ncbi:MAG: hypothetical protein COW00_15000 [Bdellovibrio sp. CG12_big_fil_rev_8_21_14_0_65_39_13]|nr:MAG: hypothetical protein COW78_00555 [Bdellovibrio sp. CG22_combo_CG10-13_8_21_14_all_39_27]PIQ58599.1 MAG: hypothetical protein COW00_15000 [Bdellovibrio sp. CG12_big_fil_rev_8_21_14_0_65_39_13]PIR33807.1 MAG: hypothetical protein COV37_14960 [Bdellovibrio sp. CG11_big_fil_rev_8_21_14_0_20_39_38]
MMSWKWGLRHQLLVSMVLLTSIFVAVFFYYTSDQQYKLFHREFISKNNSVTETVKIGLEIGLQNENLEAIKSIFDWVKNQKDFHWIGITDSSGEIFASYPSELREDFLSHQSSDLNLPTITTSRDWKSPLDHGSIVIAFSTDRYHLQSQKLFKDTAFFSFIILFLAVILSLLLSQLIAKPLTSFQKTIEQISSGHTHHRIDSESGGAEVKGLTQSFNIMMDELNEAQMKIEREKQKSENLLLNILPVKIADRLKSGEKIISDKLDSVTILFADLVGFTVLASKTQAPELVAILNRIFSDFDDLCEQTRAEKIKTIGDSYMVISPLGSDASKGAQIMISFAQQMLKILSQINRENDLSLQLRIGIHTGPAIAGVIGKKKFSYDLWGDTINIASRLESHGIPDQIQISESTQLLIKDYFKNEYRGEIELKGKGKFKTFLIS